MADEVLELETPALDTEAVEVETADVQDGAEDSSSAAPQIEGEDVPAPQIYKAIKEALKAHDPNALRQVRKALHLMDEVKSKAPDGIGPMVERMKLMEQLDDDPDDPEYVAGTRTFDEVVSNTIAERTFWRDYDNAFQSGNPAVINQMLEANPESFQKLLPAAFNRYQEVNPDGFSTLVCQSVEGYLQSNEIPLQMALLARVLPESSTDPAMQTVIDAFAKIKGVFDGIKGWAQKPIEVKSVAAKAADAQPTATLEERELNIRNVEWAGQVNPKSNTFAAQEAIRVFGEKKFTAPEIESLKKAIKDEINARIAINPAYQKRIKGFLKANNRTAYNMAVESEHKKIIQGSIKRLGEDILSKRVAAVKKPAAQAVRQEAQQTDTRYENIAGAPSTQGLKIDFARQPSGWLEKAENGYLRAYVQGRKNPVRWKY